MPTLAELNERLRQAYLIAAYIVAGQDGEQFYDSEIVRKRLGLKVQSETKLFQIIEHELKLIELVGHPSARLTDDGRAQARQLMVNTGIDPTSNADAPPLAQYQSAVLHGLFQAGPKGQPVPLFDLSESISRKMGSLDEIHVEFYEPIIEGLAQKPYEYMQRNGDLALIFHDFSWRCL